MTPPGDPPSPGPSSSSEGSTESDSEGEIQAMQDANLPEDAHEALYVGAPVSKLQCSLFIHHHFDKFKPSREEKSSILQLIGQLCPPENKCFPSIHLFDQYINNGGKVLHHL